MTPRTRRLREGETQASENEPSPGRATMPGTCHGAVMKTSLCLLLAALFLPRAADAACSHPLRVGFDRDDVESQGDPHFLRPTRDEFWIRAILEEAGCTLASVQGTISGNRRLELLASGELDLLGAASRRPEREKYAYFSLPYRTERALLFSRSGVVNTKPPTLERLLAERRVLIVPSAGWYGPDFGSLRKQFAQAGLLVEYRSPEQALRQLRARRGDYILAQDAFADYFSADKEPPMAADAIEIYAAPTHLMLSKRSITPADLEALNAAILRLQKRRYTPNLITSQRLAP